jgi:hypothetical protein
MKNLASKKHFKKRIFFFLGRVVAIFWKCTLHLNKSAYLRGFLLGIHLGVASDNDDSMEHINY